MAKNNDPNDTSSKEVDELEAELATYLVLDVLGIKLSERDLSYLNDYFDKVSDAVLAFDKSAKQFVKSDNFKQVWKTSQRTPAKCSIYITSTGT